MTRLSTEAEERLGLRSSGDSKYRARKCTIHTPPHASQRECRRYCELVLLEKAGEIRSLTQQVPFELVPRQHLFGRMVPPVKYVADFVYVERGPGGWAKVVDDCKGVQTPMFRLKARLMLQKYGIEVRLT
jgi:hypothetical protein